jgi:transcriptional regulator with XRE-family HTH domain
MRAFVTPGRRRSSTRVAQSPPAFLTPAALRWARETTGYSLDEAATKVGVASEKLEAAESGEGHLTMRQAEAAAKTYHRPIATLLLPTPPAEEPLEAQFRRLPDAPPLPWPADMRVLARRVRDRQDAALELDELLEEGPPWRSLAIEYTDDTELLAARAREELRIDLTEQQSWRDSSGFRPLREWVDAVESLGVSRHAGWKRPSRGHARVCIDARRRAGHCYQHP